MGSIAWWPSFGSLLSLVGYGSARTQMGRDQKLLAALGREGDGQGQLPCLHVQQPGGGCWMVSIVRWRARCRVCRRVIVALALWPLYHWWYLSVLGLARTCLESCVRAVRRCAPGRREYGFSRERRERDAD